MTIIIDDDGVMREIFTKDEVIKMFESLKEELRKEHEACFAREDFDTAYGISYSMDTVQEKINALRGEET